MVHPLLPAVWYHVRYLKEVAPTNHGESKKSRDREHEFKKAC